MTAATEWFSERIKSFGDTPALAYGDRIVTYAGLSELVDVAAEAVRLGGIAPGAVVAYTGDFSPAGIALMFALAQAGTILVPMGTVPADEVSKRTELGEVEWLIRTDAEDGTYQIGATGQHARHRLLLELIAAGHPGLILFSSGSSGPPKAALHDLEPLLEKFQTPRPPMRAAGFLLFDHIGGLNTIWHILSTGGFFVCLPDRSGEAVARAIERHKLELLPTSPTFINLLLLSGALERHDLSSLRVVSYGTEPMPETTLHRVHEALPNVELRQTYGMSELGILRAKSESSDSLWVKIGGEGYETRIVDGILHIKARSAMKGYLNADAPFDADGWFNTGDLVEVRGDFFRILGRVSDVINVGGQKVHPSEVESVILELPEVAEVAVAGESNPLLGHIVVAQVVPATDAGAGLDAAELRSRVRAHCRARLAAFKVPAKVIVVDTPLHSARFKKKIPTPPA
jgi:acyl-coenzyme A synthetase/AMP-(fatty) acid ligase